MLGKDGVVFGEMDSVSEFRLLGKLPFWVVTFLSVMMKEKVAKFNRSTVCSAGTLNSQV